MTKLMLVEDDNNLREIYGARLQAEGYEIVSAKDGEEALALAVKERPDLIISDVMMPKISGFDMLDILRSTAETKDTKVIMMTALSQKEDQERGEKLGADRYLVKSQVTLEDVVRVVGEVLNGQTEDANAVAQAVAPAPAPEPVAAPAPIAPTPAPEPVAAPVAPAPEPVVAPVEPAPAPTPAPVAPEPVATPAPVATPEPVAPAPVAPMPEPVAPEPVAAPVAPTPEPMPAPVAPAPVAPAPAAPTAIPVQTAAPTNPIQEQAMDSPDGSVRKSRTIQPLNDPTLQPTDINELYAKEAPGQSHDPGQIINQTADPQPTPEEQAIIDQKVATETVEAQAEAETLEAEQAELQKQIDSFSQPPAAQEAPAPVQEAIPTPAPAPQPVDQNPQQPGAVIDPNDISL